MSEALLERPRAPAPSPPPARRGLRRLSPLTVVTWLLAALLAFFIAYPLVQALLGLIGLDAVPGQTAGSPWGVITHPETLRALLNTAILVLSGGAIAVLIGAAFAWLNERTNARIGWLAEVLPLISMFVPSLAAAIGWVFLLDPDVGLLNMALRGILSPLGISLDEGPLNIYSWYGLIWTYAVFLVPFAYLAIANGLQSLDPSLEEASRMAAAGPARTFFRITLPSLKPALGSSIMLVVVMGMALFSIPVIIGTRAGIEVLPVLIVHDVTQSYPVDELSALSRSAMLLAIVLLAGFLQRRFVGAHRAQAFATIGGKGSRASTTELGKARWPARVLMVGYLAAAAVLPFLGLILVSLQSFWSATIDWASLDFSAYGEMFSRPVLREGMRNSFLLATGCATVVVVFAVLITRLTEYSRGGAPRIVDGIVKAPAAIPHIVFALALIAAFGGPPFGWTGTALILIAAYIVMYLPQATFYSAAALQQIGRPLVEASSVSGATDTRTLRRVLLPLMVPGLVSGWALIFVLMAGDITASAMLASTSTPVVGFVMLDQWSHGSYPTIAALGVTLTVVSTLVVMTALRVRNRYRLR